MLRDQGLTLLLAMFFSIAAGLVGCIALMRRMLLAGDVMSHLALPGLGIAFLYKINPLVGGAATLFFGTLLVWQLQRKSGLAPEAAIGVIFAGALAIGAAVTPNEDLAESLFGELPKISFGGFLIAAGAVLLVIFSVYLLRDELTLSIFSPDLAAATGVNVSRLDLYYLLLFSVTILVGLRFMGALLASALIIVPAATARQLTDKLSHFLLIASALSLFAVTSGFLASVVVFKFSTAGPTITMFSAALFGLALLMKRRTKLRL